MFPLSIPRLGWTMEEGTFVEWLKRDGDSVKAGDALFVIEGDKAAQDVEAAEAGILRIAPDAPSPGSIVPVGRELGCILSPGEVPPWEAAASPAPAETSARPVATAASAETPSPTVAVVPPAPRRSSPLITPRAKRVAQEHSVGWKVLNGSGRNQRIRERDVRAAICTTGGSTLHLTSRSERPDQGRATVQPLSPLRQKIVQRLSQTARTVVPVTLNTAVDATNLVNFRQQFVAAAANDAKGSQAVPSVTDLLLKLTAAALETHPQLNGHWSDTGIRLFDEVHIGLAVDTDAGLLVPVLRDVARTSLRELATRNRELVAAARARRLSADELQGSTFTITNLGMLGIDGFTPVLNSPEVAILGVGRIVRSPVAGPGDQIVIRDRLTLSLTFDHRALDGAPAARFLQTLTQAIENPAAWLVS